jgi:hypothetical protein
MLEPFKTTCPRTDPSPGGTSRRLVKDVSRVVGIRSGDLCGIGRGPILLLLELLSLSEVTLAWHVAGPEISIWTEGLPPIPILAAVQVLSGLGPGGLQLKKPESFIG